jgi:hypothetical protein
LMINSMPSYFAEDKVEEHDDELNNECEPAIASTEVVVVGVQGNAADRSERSLDVIDLI